MYIEQPSTFQGPAIASGRAARGGRGFGFPAGFPGGRGYGSALAGVPRARGRGARGGRRGIHISFGPRGMSRGVNNVAVRGRARSIAVRGIPVTARGRARARGSAVPFSNSASIPMVSTFCFVVYYFFCRTINQSESFS